MNFLGMLYAIVIIATFIFAVSKGMDSDDAADAEDWLQYHIANKQFTIATVILITELFIGVALITSGE